jgi:23S rRNA pseudouridine1911/1915/1917 synthase
MAFRAVPKDREQKNDAPEPSIGAAVPAHARALRAHEHVQRKRTTAQNGPPAVRRARRHGPCTVAGRGAQMDRWTDSTMNDQPNFTLLDRLVAQFPGASRTTLRRMLADGRVSVNGRRATRLNQPLAAGDAVTVGRARSAAAPSPSTDPARLLAPLALVFEDQDLLVIDKPAGLLTSTVPTEKRPTALARVRAYVAATSPKARLGLIHRLDRDASGLLVFSKSHRAYDALKTQFFKHTVERAYEATVHGVPSPPQGRVDTRLIERADGSVHSTDRHARGQRAITDYQTLDRRDDGTTLLRVRLLTGRKHQIRVHLSERGWPIVGDRVYGRASDPCPRLMLRAVYLALDHPKSGRRVSFTAAPSQPSVTKPRRPR